jgi:hypothetical protein
LIDYGAESELAQVQKSRDFIGKLFYLDALHFCCSKQSECVEVLWFPIHRPLNMAPLPIDQAPRTYLDR